MQKFRHSVLALGVLTGLSVTGAAVAAEYSVTITNITAGIYFTPVIVAAHDPSARMFELAGEASSEMQAIAEGGDIQGMRDLLDSIGASVSNGDGLLAPGESVTLTLSDADAGDVFSMSAMLLPTNDGFTGIDSAALPESSMTLFARSYDAGTEANDEVLGSGAPGEPGFPAPPPVVASGTGTGASGINASAEGFIHIHPGVIGDLESTGGVSDINAAVHRWSDPTSRVVITRTDGGGDGGESGDGPSAVANLSGAVYSTSAVEIFWDVASSSTASIAGYRVSRDGSPVGTTDGRSFFEEGLDAGTTYEYSVTAIDTNGLLSKATSTELTTNSQ